MKNKEKIREITWLFDISNQRTEVDDSFITTGVEDYPVCGSFEEQIMKTKEELELEFEQQYSQALEITNYLNEFDEFIKRASSLKNKIDQETDDLATEYSSKWFVAYSTFQIYIITKICHTLDLRFCFDGPNTLIRIRAPEPIMKIISEEVNRIENIIKIPFGTSDKHEGYPAYSSFEE